MDKDKKLYWSAKIIEEKKIYRRVDRTDETRFKFKDLNNVN